MKRVLITSIALCGLLSGCGMALDASLLMPPRDRVPDAGMAYALRQECEAEVGRFGWWTTLHEQMQACYARKGYRPSPAQPQRDSLVGERPSLGEKRPTLDAPLGPQGRP